MKKLIPIYLYGAVIILEGIFLFFSQNNDFNFIRITTGITLTIGAILAYYAALTRRRNHVQFVYHEIHALAMLVYGVSVLVFSNTFEKLTSYTSFLFIFYAFSEITFCTWLYNLEQKVVIKIIIVRLVLGLVIGIGTIFAMNALEFQMESFGVLFVLVGINILLYAPALKEKGETSVPPDPQTLAP